MKKKIKILSYIVVVFLGLTQFSHTQCVVPENLNSDIDKFKAAPVVFAGQVLSTAQVDSEWLITLNVIQAFKGVLPDEITISTPINLEECGYSDVSTFSPGDIYSVYTSELLETKSFSGNTKFSNTYDVIKNLNILTVSSGQSISQVSEVLISDSCKAWYDGCNECSRQNIGGVALCTLKSCEVKQQAFCREAFNVEQQEILSEDEKKSLDDEEKRRLEEEANKTATQKIQEAIEEVQRQREANSQASQGSNNQDYLRNTSTTDQNQYQVSALKDGQDLTRRSIQDEFSGQNTAVVDQENSAYVPVSKNWVNKDRDLSTIIIGLLALAFVGSWLYYFLHRKKIINHGVVQKKKEELLQKDQKIKPLVDLKKPVSVARKVEPANKAMPQKSKDLGLKKKSKTEKIKIKKPIVQKSTNTEKKKGKEVLVKKQIEKQSFLPKWNILKKIPEKLPAKEEALKAKDVKAKNTPKPARVVIAKEIEKDTVRNLQEISEEKGLQVKKTKNKKHKTKKVKKYKGRKKRLNKK